MKKQKTCLSVFKDAHRAVKVLADNKGISMRALINLWILQEKIKGNK